MTIQKNNANQTKHSSLTLQVMDDLTVQLYTNPQFDFLMDTRTVALGYGVSLSTIRSNKYNHRDELHEGVHFVYGNAVQNLDGNKNAVAMRPNALLWTKAGVIRLGFFIKSERAKAFRDWAENVILKVSAPPTHLPSPTKRRHNRLTATRLLDIMVDVAKIEDKALRLSLIKKLGV